MPILALTALDAPPFQLTVPGMHPDEDAAPRPLTFTAELRYGLLGVEGELTVFTVLESDDGSWDAGGPAFMQALGLQVVRSGEDGLALELFFLPNTYFERPFEVVASWPIDADPQAFGDDDDSDLDDAPADLVLINHCGFDDEGERLAQAWSRVVELLRERFGYVPVNDPAAQIPGWDEGFYDMLFGGDDDA